MKKISMLFSLLSLVGAGDASAKAQDLHLAKVLDIVQVSSAEGYRSFEVTFRYHCKDRVQGAFVNLMPQPFITEHTHHVVGVMLFDTGRICAAADQIEKRTVQVPIGDVVDTTPIPLQPGE